MIINNIPNKSDSGGNSLHYSNLVLEVASFVTFTAENAEEQKLIDDGYIYRASLSVEGIQENMTPEMVLSTSDIADANADISNLCRCYNGGVYSYSKKVPTKDIAVLTLKVSWNDIDTGVINMITPETIGAARAAHATQHGTDGSDPITPEMIGAVSSEDFKATVVRPNLLDNWYFGNPVNQRGQTEYKINGYTIDRWKTQNASTLVTLMDESVKVEQTASSQPRISQLTETVFPAGTTMTVSAIMKGDGINAPKIQVSKVFSSDTIFIGEANNDEWQMVTATFVTELEGAPSVALYCSTNNENPPVLEVAAAKLELGEGQTLAHQDADGNWVFNGIPNYAEELAKCQRYFYAVRTTGNNMLATAIANTTTNLLFAMPLPVPMRANPAASYSNLLYSKSGGSAGSAPSSVSPISTINNETAIRTLMLGGSFTTGTPYALILTDGGYLYLDANL